MTDKPKLNPFVKLGLDIGRLLLFFVANSRWGIFAGTAVFMVAVVVALGISYTMTRRWPGMPVVAAIIVLGVGGLRPVVHDETFIKGQPTIKHVLCSAALLARHC